MGWRIIGVRSGAIRRGGASGLIPLVLGAALLAGESLRIAQLLDRLELKLRAWFGR